MQENNVQASPKILQSRASCSGGRLAGCHVHPRQLGSVIVCVRALCTVFRATRARAARAAWVTATVPRAGSGQRCYTTTRSRSGDFTNAGDKPTVANTPEDGVAFGLRGSGVAPRPTGRAGGIWRRVRGHGQQLQQVLAGWHGRLLRWPARRGEMPRDVQPVRHGNCPSNDDGHAAG